MVSQEQYRIQACLGISIQHHFLETRDCVGQYLKKSAGHQKHWRGLFTKLLAIVIPAFALLLFIGVLCHSRQKFSRWTWHYDLPSVGRQKRFTANELMSATEGYDEKNVIGVGSQSVVYKGVLADGEVTAVKKLKETGLQDLFLREVHILGRLRHRNLIRILGYVSNLDMKALVLEFMENGSLEWHLHAHEICQMDWETRLRIAIAVANGLVYLHHDHGLTVIHGDLKPSNILIDSEFEAHVGDFGIARLVSNPGSMSTNFKGSIGYMAPEYAYATPISPKVDVYSYGVVLLEMLTLKKPTLAAFGPEMSLIQWVQSCFPDRATEVLDETLHLTNSSSRNQILGLMSLALACTEENPSNRPTMKEVSAAYLQKLP